MCAFQQGSDEQTVASPAGPENGLVARQLFPLARMAQADTWLRLTFGGIGYSLRRYYVDRFQVRWVSTLPSDIVVLDLGGEKIRKRGQFDIGRYPMRVVYVNLSRVKLPDVQADATRIPFRDECFGAVICSELLEHVVEPAAVLSEVHRVLKVGGQLFISVPFLHQIHADPLDYGRYTDSYWREKCAELGFEIHALEKQGLFWSVLADMVRAYIMAGVASDRVWERWLCRVLAKGHQVVKSMAVKWDNQPRVRESPFFSSFTTGFGIVAVKLCGKVSAFGRDL